MDHSPVDDALVGSEFTQALFDLSGYGGLACATLRHGPSDGECQFYEVSKAELDDLARQRAVMPVPLPDASRADELKREDVWWETAVYRLAEWLRV